MISMCHRLINISLIALKDDIIILICNNHLRHILMIIYYKCYFCILRDSPVLKTT